MSLRRVADLVELSVGDDGRGFEPMRLRPGSLGLGIMRERAQAIGATLEIAGEPGRGTRVRVVWRGPGAGTAGPSA